jgi:hypothetical protein
LIESAGFVDQCSGVASPPAGQTATRVCRHAPFPGFGHMMSAGQGGAVPPEKVEQVRHPIVSIAD